MQAMDQDRNHPASADVRRARGTESGRAQVPGTPQADEVIRWVTAGFLAAAALLGLVVLVAILTFALQPPGWLQMVLGVLMVAGAVVFAWLVASALRKDDDNLKRQ